MKTTYTDEEMQAVIDNAFSSQTTKATLFTSAKLWPKTFENEASHRLAIAKAFLEKLEPDPYAELKKAHSEGKVIQALGNNGSWHDLEDFDFCTLAENYRIKPEPSTFEAHGKTWTRHKAGDPIPCDRKAQVEVIYGADNRWLSKQSAQWWNWISGTIIGWRYADESTPDPLEDKPWTPAVGDVVTLASGGPLMTARCYTPENAVACDWFNTDGLADSRTFPTACLKPHKA